MQNSAPSEVIRSQLRAQASHFFLIKAYSCASFGAESKVIASPSVFFLRDMAKRPTGQQTVVLRAQANVPAGHMTCHSVTGQLKKTHKNNNKKQEHAVVYSQMYCALKK